MARSTHDKQLERARANRAAERRQRRRGLQLVAALVSVLVLVALVLGAVLLNRDADDTTDAPSEAASPVEEASADVGCPTPDGGLPTPVSEPYDQQPTVDLGGVETVVATVETTCGSFALELDASAAPETVANFVALAEDDYYDGVGFHRVVEGFMIQGGDPTGTGSGCVDAECTEQFPGYTFSDELALAEQLVAEFDGYPRGTVAMANAGPDTNGSQFFIVQAEEPYPLPPQYTVFGEVTDGLDVVDRIAAGPVEGDLAIEPAVIISIDVQR